MPSTRAMRRKRQRRQRQRRLVKHPLLSRWATIPLWHRTRNWISSATYRLAVRAQFRKLAAWAAWGRVRRQVVCPAQRITLHLSRVCQRMQLPLLTLVWREGKRAAVVIRLAVVMAVAAMVAAVVLAVETVATEVIENGYKRHR